MSKLYRAHYNEADDPEVAMMEKKRDWERRAKGRQMLPPKPQPTKYIIKCMECGKNEVVLTEEQYNQDMLGPYEQMCDDCLARCFDEQEMEYYAQRELEEGYKDEF